MSDTVAVGRSAPDFTLPGTDGTADGHRDYTLSEFAGPARGAGLLPRRQHPGVHPTAQQLHGRHRRLPEVDARCWPSARSRSRATTASAPTRAASPSRCWPTPTRPSARPTASSGRSGSTGGRSSWSTARARSATPTGRWPASGSGPPTSWWRRSGASARPRGLAPAYARPAVGAFAGPLGPLRLWAQPRGRRASTGRWAGPLGSEPMFVLGIDPGLSRCGYGVVEQARARSAPGRGGRRAAHRSRSGPCPSGWPPCRPTCARCSAEHRPAVVAVERVLFQANARTAIPVAQAAGLAMVEGVAAGCRGRRVLAQPGQAGGRRLRRRPTRSRWSAWCRPCSASPRPCGRSTPPTPSPWPCATWPTPRCGPGAAAPRLRRASRR